MTGLITRKFVSFSPIFLLAAFLFLLPLALDAQSDTLLLPTLEVRSKPWESGGFLSLKPDPLPASNLISVADRLRFSNIVLVRPNAPGTLATMSARGMGPAHTAVIWNGLNLQNAMSSILDANLLDLGPMEQLEFRAGGEGVGYGSGAVGGNLIVKTIWPDSITNWQPKLDLSVGSFGRKQAQMELGYQHHSIQYSGSAKFQKAHNQFPFINTTLVGAPKVRQNNNQLAIWDVHQRLSIQLNTKNALQVYYWYQTANRAIPPAMTAANQNTWQKDKANRLQLVWDHQPSRRSQLQTRVAWIEERLLFQLAGDVDTSHAQTMLLQTAWNQKIHQNLQGNITVSNSVQWAQVDGYADTARWYVQHRPAIYGGLVWTRKAHQITMGLRKEWLNTDGTPFIWSLSGLHNYHQLGLRWQVGRNFRWPTFNDRFWQAWGNPDLRPESGYSADVGLSAQIKDLKATVMAFHTILDDWILWLPGSDGVFRPGNYRKVWSRGIESTLHYSRQLSECILKTGVRYHFTRSTHRAVYNPDASILGKQLPYVPVHTAAAQFQASWRWLKVAYTHQFTGARFTGTDNKNELKWYDIGGFLLEYQHNLKGQHSIRLFLRLDNCWDASYQYFQYQAMPGFNWQAGFQWQ